MPILLAMFLGLVQGLTEFLPVSSSGHLSIFQNIFGLSYDAEEHLLFDVLLHLATLISVCIVYHRDLRSMIHDSMELLLGHTGEEEDGRLKPSVRFVLLIIVGTLPLLLILPFHNELEKLYVHTGFIGFALLITGALLYVSTKFSGGRKTERTATILDVLLVGVGQAIATIPGISRSGTTITVGLSRDFKRSFAVRLSFLMSIPAILGSTLLTLISALKNGVEWANFPAYLAGMAVAGIVGYFALVFLKRYIEKKPLTYFAYYCWLAGAVALIGSFIKG